MTMYEQQRFNLVEHTKTCVADIGEGFTEPEADWAPMMLFTGDKKVNIMPLMFSSDDQKDDMAKIMMASIMLERSREVAFVSSAWVAAYERDAKVAIAPSEHPDRREVLFIHHFTPDGQAFHTAPILRDPTNKPILGQWKVEMTTMSGRFQDAIMRGMRLAANMTPDIVAYMTDLREKEGTEEALGMLVCAFDKAMAQAQKEWAKEDAT